MTPTKSIESEEISIQRATIESLMIENERLNKENFNLKQTLKRNIFSFFLFFYLFFVCYLKCKHNVHSHKNNTKNKK